MGTFDGQSLPIEDMGTEEEILEELRCPSPDCHKSHLSLAAMALNFHRSTTFDFKGL